jgi:hypothetical protein
MIAERKSAGVAGLNLYGIVPQPWNIARKLKNNNTLTGNELYYYHAYQNPDFRFQLIISCGNAFSKAW